MKVYDPFKPAIDQLDAVCPDCHSEGVNRIWLCGSMMCNGEFVKGSQCHDESKQRAFLQELTDAGVPIADNPLTMKRGETVCRHMANPMLCRECRVS